VATVVDGLTKIAKVQFRTSTEQQVENFRKLLLSMAQDARVILIKLADRLHNMRTLDFLRDDKRRRIAMETRDIYAPLAHRLGVAAIKWELEDLCFKYLEPEAYRELARKIADKRREREDHIETLREPLQRELRAAGIECEVTGRPKHLWSIYRKMVQREKRYEEIYDLMAVRVTVDTIADCYHALGVIHNRWTPLQERFHDYIATPKSNMYQSLHTTIFGPGGRLYEIQIRTREMHRTAEYGIAAHWKYKEGQRGDDVDDTLTWFRQVLEWQQETKEPEEFMEFLRIDLFQDEIFVFTPMGDVKQLPKGATPIDFAFTVHTEVGLHCAGARVNGRFTPISRELKNGDTVEIVTDPKQRPSRDWLAFVKTARARNKIRQWIKDEEFDDSVRLGRDFIEREIRKQRKEKVGEDRFGEVAKKLEYEDAQHLFAALGRGDLGPSALIRELWPQSPGGAAQAAVGVRAPGVARARRAGGGADPGDGQPHGPLLPVLPAGARRQGDGVRHPRPRHLHPPHRLSQHPAAQGTPRAARGHRVGGAGGGAILRPHRAHRHGPARPLRRHRQHHLGGEHQHQERRHPRGRARDDGAVRDRDREPGASEPRAYGDQEGERGGVGRAAGAAGSECDGGGLSWGAIGNRDRSAQPCGAYKSVRAGCLLTDAVLLSMLSNRRIRGSRDFADRRAAGFAAGRLSQAVRVGNCGMYPRSPVDPMAKYRAIVVAARVLEFLGA
jgi:ppGpp synthetase/RelA/SpoT-type nucleotidyltranferase